MLGRGESDKWKGGKKGGEGYFKRRWEVRWFDGEKRDEEKK